MKHLISVLFMVVLISTAVIGQVNSTNTNTDSIKAVELTPIVIKALAASPLSPFTKTEISKTQLAVMNNGSDLPIMLNNVANMVSTSDAGAGVGYTNLRMRGSDITRINVTLNGVPVNDAEGQGVFFVNFADLGSSIKSLQIQRGVGSSTNGPGAFGASININSIDVQAHTGMQYSADYSSFNTWRNTLKVYSGLLNNKVNVSARISRITSQGFIQRSGSQLTSGQFTMQYLLSKKITLTANYMNGHERTGQAWTGVPQDSLATNRTFNELGLMPNGVYYKNQTDNYQQQYYQLFAGYKPNSRWQINMGLYATRGKGYYEEYKQQQQLSAYNLSPIITEVDTINTADIIRQLWLDNLLTGTQAQAICSTQQHQLIIGGNMSVYNGEHYGKVINVAGAPLANYKWYHLDACKIDASTFVKYEYKVSEALLLYTDVQYRHVVYNINGFRNNPLLKVSNRWNFLNPKLGLTYQLLGGNNLKQNVYASFAIANKEPNRDDLETNIAEAPLHELLMNTELGYNCKSPILAAGVNIYYMNYRNQLVPTGRINDVGAFTRVNTPQSYRAGIEAELAIKLSKVVSIEPNIALSINKIKVHQEYIFDYDSNMQRFTQYSNTNIALSPNIVGANVISIHPLAYANKQWQSFAINIMHKYVGRQYLDNTQEVSRSINAYQTLDIILQHQFTIAQKYKLQLHGGVFNALNAFYQSNGYTYGYIAGGQSQYFNYLFPQAGRRYNIGLVFTL
jgi:iron complex outermembrane recepter protein